jgi:carbamoyl-phosphate synthase small subunit
MNYSEKWKAERERKAYLALADGTVFHGVAFGAKKEALGEVVFNTGMCGYQEILTDPSYAGQFVTLTPAEVGNYGINSDDIESRKLFLSGLVIGDLTAPSNWRSEKSLDDYLKENGVPGIYGVDTRALTLHLREHGNQKAFLCVSASLRAEDAIAKAREWEGLDGQDYAAKVTCEKRYDFLATKDTKNTKEKDGLCELCDLCGKKEKPYVVCYDFGVKTNILRSLASWAKVTVVPAKTPAEEVLAMKPDGVFLSNGPADPAAVTYAIENIRKLLSSEWRSVGVGECRSDGVENSPTHNSPSHPLPIMGICLGHQLLSLACGAKTGRLKFGHHGCNHPVKNLATGHVEITSQNHNFAVLPETVPDCLEVTHINLNDNSIEGVRHKTLPAFSVQYHPESCPGPHDSKYLFDEFRKMIMNHEIH